MPSQYADSATPRANNRGSASLSNRQRPGLPMSGSSTSDGEEEEESSRESFRDEDEEGSYQTSVDSGEDEEIDSEFDLGEDEDYSGSENTSAKGENSEAEESGSYEEGESEYESGSEEGIESEKGEGFEDEYSQATSVIEFTGMEAVEEKQKKATIGAASSDDDSPPPGVRTAAKGGDDLLKQYMGVLHSGNTDDDNSPVVRRGTMEDRISKGVAESSHRRNDFIVNSSDLSIGSKSTRQSRREAVMVAQRLNFLEDNVEEMTYTRQIALYLMKRYKWYNPRLGEATDDIYADESSHMGGAFRTQDGYPMLKVKPENPSLEAAWAYFEHFTLTRYVYEPKPMEDKAMMTRICNKFKKGDKEMERAERNENILPTKLYDPIWTPHNQLGDWGIGWGLYFATVRGLMILCFLGGLFSLPNMLFFAGSTYSSGQEGVELLLASSAICTDESWVVCPRCAGLTRVELPYERLGYAYNEDLNLNMTFARKNNCEGANMNTGMVHFGILLLILLGLFVLNRYVYFTFSI